MAVEIALYQPQIPQNTGNIGRLCVGFGVKLSLIKPLGFELSDKQLKRAGLDYWPFLKLEIHQDFKNFWSKNQQRRVVISSKFSTTQVDEFTFSDNDLIIMGNELKGFPMELSKNLSLPRVRIPMKENIRSYNLANSAAMMLYEAHRQLKW